LILYSILLNSSQWILIILIWAWRDVRQCLQVVEEPEDMAAGLAAAFGQEFSIWASEITVPQFPYCRSIHLSALDLHFNNNNNISSGILKVLAGGSNFGRHQCERLGRKPGSLGCTERVQRLKKGDEGMRFWYNRIASKITYCA
jgi:hypothetical protein